MSYSVLVSIMGHKESLQSLCRIPATFAGSGDELELNAEESYGLPGNGSSSLFKSLLRKSNLRIMGRFCGFITLRATFLLSESLFIRKFGLSRLSPGFPKLWE